MARQTVTTQELREMKARGERIAALTAYDHLTATLLDASGVDVVLVGDSVATVLQGRDTTISVTMDQMVYHCELVSRGAKRALVVADMPFLSYQVGPEDALRNAGRLLKEGRAAAVKVEGGGPVIDTVRALYEAGIAVMGHVGLTPQRIHQFGTYRVRGTTPEQSERILSDARALAEAGAFAVVLEKIPASLGREITEQVPVPTIGIGAGPHCDGQILVTHDMLGLFTRFKPRFVRRYAELQAIIREAVTSFAKDVKEGRFPDKPESY